MRIPKICIGFGPTEGKCSNPSGAKRGPFWCEDCNRARIEYLSAQFDALRRSLGMAPKEEG